MPHHFIEKRDIVLFSFQPWNSDIAFNFKDMAYELARYNRVLFIDRALDRSTMLKQWIGKSPASQAPEEYLGKVQDNFWVLHPKALLESGTWSPGYRLFDFFNRINNKRLASEIRDAMLQLEFSNVILINDNDFYRGLYMKELLPVRKYIYYIRDFLTIQPFFAKYGPRCEKELVEKVDLVVANSAYLAEYTRKWNPMSFDIGQGCELADFLDDSMGKPADLASIPGPVIGYCGAITALRLDENIIRVLSEAFPQYSVVLVGPDDGSFEHSPLRNMKNVFFLGGKTPKQIPAYMHHFDICMNPQLVNPLTIGNYPRKIDEYLAVGKPVLATRTEAMEMFRDYTFLCENADEYVAAVKHIAGSEATRSSVEKQRRREFALTHTWENSIGLLGDAYFETQKKAEFAG